VLLTALFSLDALKDCFPDRDADTQARADGSWHADGFKATNPRGSSDVEQSLDGERRFSVMAVPDTSAYEALRELIKAARSVQLPVKIYISPIHHRVSTLFADAGKSEQYIEWRRRIAVIAQEEGAEFYDFSQDTGIALRPIDGRSGYFFDGLHFMPKVGDAILYRLGFKLRHAVIDLPELPEQHAPSYWHRDPEQDLRTDRARSGPAQRH